MQRPVLSDGPSVAVPSIHGSGAEAGQKQGLSVDSICIPSGVVVCVPRIPAEFPTALDIWLSVP